MVNNCRLPLTTISNQFGYIRANARLIAVPTLQSCSIISDETLLPEGGGEKVGLMTAENNSGNTETVFSPEDITRTELSCLALVAEGCNVDAMSDKLALSRREIEVLLFCAQRKLGADNLLQAVSIAMSKRMIPV